MTEALFPTRRFRRARALTTGGHSTKGLSLTGDSPKRTITLKCADTILRRSTYPTESNTSPLWNQTVLRDSCGLDANSSAERVSDRTARPDS